MLELRALVRRLRALTLRPSSARTAGGARREAVQSAGLLGGALGSLRLRESVVESA